MIGKCTHPGTFLADMFPWSTYHTRTCVGAIVDSRTPLAVKHLPSWMPFHREAREGKAMIAHLVTKPFEHVKQEMVRASLSF